MHPQKRKYYRRELAEFCVEGVNVDAESHGPITREWTGSATKRVLSALRVAGVLSETEFLQITGAVR